VAELIVTLGTRLRRRDRDPGASTATASRCSEHSSRGRASPPRSRATWTATATPMSWPSAGRGSDRHVANDGAGNLGAPTVVPGVPPRAPSRCCPAARSRRRPPAPVLVARRCSPRPGALRSERGDLDGDGAADVAAVDASAHRRGRVVNGAAGRRRRAPRLARPDLPRPRRSGRGRRSRSAHAPPTRRARSMCCGTTAYQRAYMSKQPARCPAVRLAATACAATTGTTARRAARHGRRAPRHGSRRPPARSSPTRHHRRGEWTTSAERHPWPRRPGGIVNGPMWAGFVAPYTQIDNDTDVDFFVFKTATRFAGQRQPAGVLELRGQPARHPHLGGHEPDAGRRGGQLGQHRPEAARTR